MNGNERRQGQRKWGRGWGEGIPGTSGHELVELLGIFSFLIYKHCGFFKDLT